MCASCSVISVSGFKHDGERFGRKDGFESPSYTVSGFSIETTHPGRANSYQRVTMHHRPSHQNFSRKPVRSNLPYPAHTENYFNHKYNPTLPSSAPSAPPTSIIPAPDSFISAPDSFIPAPGSYDPASGSFDPGSLDSAPGSFGSFNPVPNFIDPASGSFNPALKLFHSIVPDSPAPVPSVPAPFSAGVRNILSNPGENPSFSLNPGENSPIVSFPAETQSPSQTNHFVGSSTTFPNQQFSSQPFSNQHFPNQPFSNQPFSNQPFSDKPFPNQPLSNDPVTVQKLNLNDLRNIPEALIMERREPILPVFPAVPGLSQDTLRPREGFGGTENSLQSRKVFHEPPRSSGRFEDHSGHGNVDPSLIVPAVPDLFIQK